MNYTITEQTITRQEGNTGTLEFTVPKTVMADDPSVTADTDLYFVVYRAGEKQFEKDTWTVTDDTTRWEVVAEMEESDTLGIKGTNRWELWLVTAAKNERIGAGDFEIVKTKERKVRP